MFEAELAHKLPELQHREDYLTSCIFGSLKYVPPTRGILKVLGPAMNYRSQTDFATYLRRKGLTSSDLGKARLLFWPNSKTYGEPDLVLVGEGNRGSYLVAIEVKYFSRKHGEGEDDQLFRYYMGLEGPEGRRTFDLRSIRGFTGDFLALVYVTQHEAEVEIDQTLRTLASKGVLGADDRFFHLRWPDVAKRIKSMLAHSKGRYEKAIYRDIADLLTVRSLTPFSRFSALPASLSPELLMETPVFFAPDEKKHRHFPGFTRPPEQLVPRLLDKAAPAFLHIQCIENASSFNGFFGLPKHLRLRYQGHIFYRGGSQ